MRGRSSLTASFGSVLLAAVLLAVGATPSAAAPVLVPKDASGHVVVDVTTADGALAGTITLANPNDSAVTVRITGKGAIAKCTFATATIAPAATVDVRITSDRCSLASNGASATMRFSGATRATVLLELKPQPTTAATSLGAPLVAFLLAALLALVLLAGIFATRARSKDGARLALADELAGLPTGWTFQDSWATSVGTVSTLFVGIFGTTDVVKALTGSASDSLPGRLLIIAAVSALLLGLAPLAVKAIGPASQTATVRGLLVGSWLTTTAVCGQILAVYAAFAVTDPTGSAWHDALDAVTPNWALVFAVALVVFLGFYVVRTLSVLLTPSPTPPPVPSDELLAASATLVAAEVCCDESQHVDTSSTLLDLAYVRAVNHLVRLRSAASAMPPARSDDTIRARKLGTPDATAAPPRYADVDEILAAAQVARPARSAVL